MREHLVIILSLLATPAPARAQSVPPVFNGRTLTPSARRLSDTQACVKGNQVAAVGSMQTLNSDCAGNSTYQTKAVGGYWTQKSYSGYAFNQEFNGSNTDAAVNAPATALLAIGYANGTSKDVVANMGVAIANANRSSLFGFNFIATSTGGKSAIFRGGEIDVEPAPTDTALPGSAGLYINVFNKAVNAAIQLGGQSGGTWSQGLACAGIASNGDCLSTVGSATMRSLLNSSRGSFNTAALILGTGASQGIEFGTAGGETSPYLYGDSSNNLVVQMGASGSFAIKNNTGASNLLVVSQNGSVTTTAPVILKRYTVATLPNCSTALEGGMAYVTDATAPTYNGALSGGGTIVVPVFCSGSAWSSH